MESVLFFYWVTRCDAGVGEIQFPQQALRLQGSLLADSKTELPPIGMDLRAPGAVESFKELTADPPRGRLSREKGGQDLFFQEDNQVAQYAWEKRRRLGGEKGMPGTLPGPSIAWQCLSWHFILVTWPPPQRTSLPAHPLQELYSTYKDPPQASAHSCMCAPG